MEEFRTRNTFLAFVMITVASCSDNTRVSVKKWPDGTPKVVKNYYHRDTLRYQLISYFKSGIIKELTHFEKDIKNGWNIHYYESGIVKDSIYLQENTPIATSNHFHRNGKLKSDGSYLQGRKNGSWNFYDSTGVLNEITYYNFGQKNGKSSFFNHEGWLIKEVDKYPEGGIKEIINYQDSLRHGFYELFELNGNRVLTGDFLKGKKNGTTWISYHSTGSKFKEIKYIYENEWDTLLINLWNPNGEQTVKDGNGYFRFNNYSDCNGKRIIESQTTLYYENGKQTNIRVMARQDCH